MTMMKIFDVSGSGVSAQAQRLNTIASNLANADSVAGPDGKAYKARHTLFQTHIRDAADPTTAGVRVARIVEDESEGRKVHDPKHPLADADGYVTMPNVNVVDEMVNMISASRSYQSNLEVMNTAKTLLAKTLGLGSN